MASMPSKAQFQKWNDDGKAQFRQFLSDAYDEGFHPVMMGQVEIAYIRGYTRAKLEQWIIDAQVEAFARQLERE